MMKIPLTLGKFALVDDKDFDEVNKHKWYALKNNRTFYAVRAASRKVKPRGKIHMHRAILGLVVGDGLITDHKNCDGLDNRQENLRTVSQAQNCANTQISTRNKSGYKGVSFNRYMRRWKASLCRGGVRRHLGYFHSKKIAANTYNNVAKILYGDYARLNKI